MASARADLHRSQRPHRAISKLLGSSVGHDTQRLLCPNVAVVAGAKSCKPTGPHPQTTRRRVGLTPLLLAVHLADILHPPSQRRGVQKQRLVDQLPHQLALDSWRGDHLLLRHRAASTATPRHLPPPHALARNLTCHPKNTKAAIPGGPRSSYPLS